MVSEAAPGGSKHQARCARRGVRVDKTPISKMDVTTRLQDYLTQYGAMIFAPLKQNEKRVVFPIYYQEQIRVVKGSSDVDEIIKEYHLLQQLKHCNVIRVGALIQLDSLAFFEMKFASLKDMTTLIEKRQVDGKVKHIMRRTQARKYIGQMIRLLFELHKNKILHGDIKLDNYLAMQSGSNGIQLLFSDFGSSVDLKVDADSRYVDTTDCNKPPECFNNKDSIWTEKCDIYQLGIVIYILMFKEHPFVPNYGQGENMTLGQMQEVQHRKLEGVKLKQQSLYKQRMHVSNVPEQRKQYVLAETKGAWIVKYIKKMLDPKPANRPTIGELIALKQWREYFHFGKQKQMPMREDIVPLEFRELAANQQPGSPGKGQIQRSPINMFNLFVIQKLDLHQQFDFVRLCKPLFSYSQCKQYITLTYHIDRDPAREQSVERSREQSLPKQQPQKRGDENSVSGEPEVSQITAPLSTQSTNESMRIQDLRLEVQHTQNPEYKAALLDSLEYQALSHFPFFANICCIYEDRQLLYVFKTTNKKMKTICWLRSDSNEKPILEEQLDQIILQMILMLQKLHGDGYACNYLNPRALFKVQGKSPLKELIVVKEPYCIQLYDMYCVQREGARYARLVVIPGDKDNFCLSPEQRLDPVVSRRSNDIYALGATAYQLLMRETPVNMSQEEIIQKINRMRGYDLAKRVITKCLSNHLVLTIDALEDDEIVKAKFRMYFNQTQLQDIFMPQKQAQVFQRVKAPFYASPDQLIKK